MLLYVETDRLLDQFPHRNPRSLGNPFHLLQVFLLHLYRHFTILFGHARLETITGNPVN